jgi:hypothetical protein
VHACTPEFGTNTVTVRRGKHAYAGHFGDHLASGRRREPEQFTCFLCEGGTDRLTGQTWSVPSGQTVIQAQQAHHLTHPLALREAVDTLVRNLDTGVTIIVQPEAVDPGSRMVTVTQRDPTE